MDDDCPYSAPPFPQPVSTHSSSMIPLPESHHTEPTRGSFSGTAPHGSEGSSKERVVVHVDMDCFFVSAIIRNKYAEPMPTLSHYN